MNLLIDAEKLAQLAIARALMIKPKMLLLEEPSLGLAPIGIKKLARSGLLALYREP